MKRVSAQEFVKACLYLMPQKDEILFLPTPPPEKPSQEAIMEVLRIAQELNVHVGNPNK